MWTRLAAIIIRQRLPILIALGLATAFMASLIPDLRLQYTFGGLLPKTDSTYLEYDRFLTHFGAEGNVLLIGTDEKEVTTPEGMQAWFELAETIRTFDVQVDTTRDGEDNPVSLPMIDSVFATTHAYTIEKDTARRRFALRPVVPPGRLEMGGKMTANLADSITAELHNLPF